MKRSFATLWVFLFVAGCVTREPEAVAPPATPVVETDLTPVGDHHQHLFSPAIIRLIGTGSGLRPLAASELLPLLDAAGTRRAVILSVAYMYGSPARTVTDEYAKVRAENDWTAAQAAQSPGRLIAFCGVNPLRDYALEEIARCASSPALGRGVKFHFANSDVQLDDPAHVEKLRRVFRAANELEMAVVVHLRANVSKKRPYGAAQARVFLEQLLPVVPDVPVHVAHLAGTGPGYSDPASDDALSVLAEAVAAGDTRTRNLWFDVASLASPDISAEHAALLVRRIRQIGVDRILWGADAAAGRNLPPREAWASFRRLPLTDEELATIARNEAPYMR